MHYCPRRVADETLLKVHGQSIINNLRIVDSQSVCYPTGSYGVAGSVGWRVRSAAALWRELWLT